MTELKKLSKYCEFGANLEDNLRDQFVCGLRSDVIRQRLFAEEKLTYTTAIKLSISLEAAERDAAAVEHVEQRSDGGGGGRAAAGAPVLSLAPAGARASHGRGRTAPTSGSATGQRPGTQAPCTACGANTHSWARCRFKNFICSKCKQRGHLRRQCPNPGAGPYRRDGRGIHHVDTRLDQAAPPRDEESEDSLSELEEDLHQLSLNGYRPV
ncbi:uncharacterized protein LOC119690846 [Plutella xylostella]|nr:uncharacterized protein LOC119690846 [Plutella xylostella]